MEPPLARNKDELIASDDELGRMVAGRLGKRFGKLMELVSKLGVDFATGMKRGKRDNTARLARLKQAAKRMHRLRRLRRA